ncbi:hypothetical protein AB5I41_03450 [Sphingomonas sp. MMS24-JH45]
MGSLRPDRRRAGAGDGRGRCPHPVEIPLARGRWCRRALVLGEARALVVDAGNSNAFTGGRGRAAVEAIAARAAAAYR